VSRSRLSRQIAELLARVGLGDRAAFAQLYRETGAHLFGVVLRIQPDRARAEARTVSRHVGGDDEHDLPNAAAGPQELLLQAAEARQFTHCMQGLSTERQQCVALAYCQGLSHAVGAAGGWRAAIARPARRRYLKVLLRSGGSASGLRRAAYGTDRCRAAAGLDRRSGLGRCEVARHGNTHMSHGTTGAPSGARRDRTVAGRGPVAAVAAVAGHGPAAGSAAGRGPPGQRRLPELALDADDDGTLRWGEIRAREADIVRLVEGAVLRARRDCAAPVRTLRLDYRLFATSDPSHRCLLRLGPARGAGRR